jgi:retron-type reverse transcriptase
VDALKEVERPMWENEYVVDADIEAYFDHVEHGKLRSRMQVLPLEDSLHRASSLLY